ncbi:hypothetical protein [Bordetella petrii]|uniref:hypothetical protein n=1 Tax=Bordetella petrii TaxID=94624 RepID=UPI0012DE4C36|nr:hypothetical protein [Bordetella petrii]
MESSDQKKNMENVPVNAGELCAQRTLREAQRLLGMRCGAFSVPSAEDELRAYVARRYPKRPDRTGELLDQYFNK